ncbi:protein of unknown function (DUF342 family) [Sporomusaceae bacterium BoRhaA]|uniref:DUF342 domain-containing protein n=1 Tax=Pelorhabdus rhamnosifermentans TaxID=2772457 RepID=UPI001C0619B3|nr:FapA family protein [Pelorhabdus rhamnosifermentans]MBU2700009.1 protein of unknown function (DUF342 family) [Pelorhabdus rhamnosifermentans]
MDKRIFATKKDGRYQITVTDVGVYLSVWPSVNGGTSVSITAVIKDLTDRNLVDFDRDFISEVIREAVGTPVLLINVLPKKDGRYQITVTDSGVYLSVWPSANGGASVSKTAVIKDLTDRNLADFDRDFISEVIREALGTPVLLINVLPSKDGRYQITAMDAGIYLSVWPPVNSGSSVSKAVVIEDLTNQKLTDFDSELISSVIREATGTPVLVIDSGPSIQPAQSIRVKVDINRLEASIDLNILPDAPTATVSQLLDELKAVGVVYGIDEQALETLSKLRLATNFICARGVLACNGDNAYLKYYVDPDRQGRPDELEDGRVDFKEINSFLCVEKEQILVEKISPTAGIPGMDVYGEPLPALPGKDKRLPAGKNVIVVDDRRLYAAIDGHLHIFLDKRINVIPVIVIDGDVDYNTGNIDFKGSVIVRGTVQPNFCVKAGGNVEVSGAICGGTVEANSIIVRQGMNRGIIKARERLVINFIENATVYADEDVIVSDVIMNSQVFAGSRVIIEGRRGLVLGGRISAGELIRSVTVGNKLGVATELEVSLKPFLKDELIELRQQIKKDERLYTEMELSITYFRNQGVDNFSAEKKERYKKNEAEFNTLLNRIEETRQRIMNIESIIYSLKPGRIRVSGSIYPGTKISIGSSVKNIQDVLQYVSLYVQQGEIKFSSLR